MRMYDLIQKKKEGGTLSAPEMKFLLDGYMQGEIPEYQMAAFLMAVYFQGMSGEETARLTETMAVSGEMLDLSGIPGVKVDKHSTGGIGDKTTLIITPIVAACGGKVAKMSGRGLGYTGGTIDKLEAIPGFCTELTTGQFIAQVNRIGCALVSQLQNLAPLDKKIYALRDVTATTDSIPLIASSIMSKKIAAGADAIVLDIKVGKGAFMKNMSQAKSLAETMIRLGKAHGRKVRAFFTDMDVPLGRAVGNAPEVWEAVEVLKGKGEAGLTELCVALAREMLVLSGLGSRESCEAAARQSLKTGTALQKFSELVQAQGGDSAVIEEPERLLGARETYEVKLAQSGYVQTVDAEACGRASVLLGAGREKAGDRIDHSAGILLLKRPGEWAEAGEPAARLYAARGEKMEEAAAAVQNAFYVAERKPKPYKEILEIMEK